MMNRRLQMKQFSEQLKKRIFEKSILLIAAHQDDETIGAGILISKARSIHIAHVTDGSPNLKIAKEGGFKSRRAYRLARQKELFGAMSLAGVRPKNLISLGLGDQKTYLHLSTATKKLERLIWKLRPDFLLTHPYEGGHPDHDSTAFAVHQARRLIFEKKKHYIPIVEFASYHGWKGKFRVGDFLSRPDDLRAALRFSPEMRKLKLEMFGKFRSQSDMLEFFRVDRELFRLAPDYDFTKTSARGRPIYDSFKMEITSKTWLRESRRALKLLSK